MSIEDSVKRANLWMHEELERRADELITRIKGTDFTKLLRDQQLKILALEAALKDACDALEDFRVHGMRTDTNPTGMFHDCGHFTLESRTWQDYLDSADDAVRERARAALESIRKRGGV